MELAESGQHGLAQVAATTADGVILDVGLPGPGARPGHHGPGDGDGDGPADGDGPGHGDGPSFGPPPA